jgi:prolyl-tRNA synthetase
MINEIQEETGYRNIINTQKISDNTSFVAYIPHKNNNCHAQVTVMYAEVDGEAIPLADHEAAIHRVELVDAKELDDAILIDNVKYARDQYKTWNNEKKHRKTSEQYLFLESNDFSFVRPLEIKIDTDPNRSMGWKLKQYELEGVPLVIPVGKKDREK